MKKIYFVSLVAAIIAITYISQRSLAENPSSKTPASEQEKPADQATISAEAAAKAGIATEVAKPARIAETLSLTGRISLNQNTTARIKARFPGVVREVGKGLGEAVKKGEVLAKVESNDSLLVYPIVASVSGVILERRTNVGDVAGDQALFIIADLSNVWAEFYVFPSDMAKIRIGLPAQITTLDGKLSANADIASLLPVAEGAGQAMVARLTLSNASGLWRVGMTVNVEVVLAEQEVPVAVKTTAIQQQEGQPVIYVKDGQSYSMRRVELGAADNQMTEIRSGLQTGEQYVTTNSFVVKADIGKSGAEDED